MSEVCSTIARSGLYGSLQSICRRAGFYNFGCGGLSLERRQRSEQYFTSLQFLAHFSLHAKGFPHVAHVFIGRSAFLTILAIWILSYSTCLRNANEPLAAQLPKWQFHEPYPIWGSTQRLEAPDFNLFSCPLELFLFTLRSACPMTGGFAMFETVDDQPIDF